MVNVSLLFEYALTIFLFSYLFVESSCSIGYLDFYFVSRYGVILEKLKKQDPSLMGRIRGCIVDSAPVAAPDPQVNDTFGSMRGFYLHVFYSKWFLFI